MDKGPDPSALIAFLEAHKTLAGLVATKSAMLDELRLDQARSALDVGGGTGDDVLEMACAVPKLVHGR